jgi:hypothetical protein
MNAIANPSRSSAHFAEPHATHKLKWLLKRELWEHKGGFIWAPLITGAIFLFFTLIGGGTGQFILNRNGTKIMNFEGQEIPLSQVDWDKLIAAAGPKDLEQYAQVVNGFTLMSGIWPLMVFGFVVFFYLLGSLYDERRDRSVLFWKSMPVSDGLTVISKLLTALVVAPIIAVSISFAVMIATGLILSIFIALNGGNPFTIYWSQLEPLKLLGASFGWLPVYAFWAMPTAGWLMLCSAWAKSKPFLWAVLVPVLAGVVVTWFGLFDNNSGGSGWFWQHIVARLLTSAWPGSHLLGYADTPYLQRLDDSPNALFGADGVISGLHLFATPQLWIGVAAGAAMIYAAIRLRRWRDDA